MIRHFIILLFLSFFFNIALSQEVVSNFHKGYKSNSFYMEEAIYNNNQSVKLKELKYENGKIGKYITYYLEFNQIPIYGSQVKKVKNEQSEFTKTATLPKNTSPINSEFPNNTEINKFLNSNSLFSNCQWKKVYFPTEYGLLPCVLINQNNGAEINNEYVIDKDLNILFQSDVNYYLKGPKKDSTVKAFVFNPDPITFSKSSYKGNYKDFNDQTNSSLDSALTEVDITLQWDSNGFYLESDYIVIEEHSDPVIQPYSSKVDSFKFNRSQNPFEELNAFYHINKFKTYLNSLGYQNLGNHKIYVDVHGFGGDDQSAFNANANPPTLTFGTGGVDDAEDADVIIHEYCHSLSADASPNTNSGLERQSLEEGMADYFSAVYSREISPYKWTDIFNWDGHNEFWDGRSADVDRDYTERNSNIYWNAEIWSSFLIDVYEEVGRATMDELVLESLYQNFIGMTFIDGVNILFEIDSVLNNKTNYETIRRWAIHRKILNPQVGIESKNKSTTYTLSNTFGFAEGTSNLHITNKQDDFFSISVYDLLGKLKFFKNGIKDNFQLSPNWFNSGIYFIQIEAQNESLNYQIVKW